MLIRTVPLRRKPTCKASKKQRIYEHRWYKFLPITHLYRIPILEYKVYLAARHTYKWYNPLWYVNVN